MAASLPSGCRPSLSSSSLASPLPSGQRPSPAVTGSPVVHQGSPAASRAVRASVSRSSLSNSSPVLCDATEKPSRPLSPPPTVLEDILKEIGQEEKSFSPLLTPGKEIEAKFCFEYYHLSVEFDMIVTSFTLLFQQEMRNRETMSFFVSAKFSPTWFFLNCLKRDYTKDFFQELGGKIVSWGKKEAPLSLQTSLLVSPNSKTEKVKEDVEKMFFYLVRALIASVKNFPHFVRNCCSVAFRGISDSFGEERAREFLVSYLFTQLICPALNSLPLHPPPGSSVAASPHLGVILAHFALLAAIPDHERQEFSLPEYLNFFETFVQKATQDVNHFLELFIAL